MVLTKKTDDSVKSKVLPNMGIVSRNITYNMTGMFLTAILILFLIPVYLVIGILIWLFCGSPIFYLQDRVGKDGKIFKMYKFRTMRVGADKEQICLISMNEADGPVFKIHNDPRLTPLGKFLCHTGLDELPQLFNIVKGEMDLVGPRPLPVSEEIKINQIYRTKRTRVKPGLVSPWILNGYHKLKFDEWMQSDVEYIDRKNCFYDIWLLVRSMFLIVRLIAVEIF